jgi:putative iron-dependent peroxidase
MPAQPGILAPAPRTARFLTFRLAPGADTGAALAALAEDRLASGTIVGIGGELATVPGLRPHPHLVGPGVNVPATGAALWVRLVDEDRGALVHATRRLADRLAPALVLDEVIDAFQHGESRDLTGYEDGTENPQGDVAAAVALVADAGPGLDGSSYLAIERWVHTLSAFDRMSPAERDDAMGRNLETNEELPDAPPSAHVKRAAQESFTPAAFVLRRSMPWTSGAEAGLVFLAFGRSFDAFEAILRRMVGEEDGVVDGLFRFTRPVTGAYVWCPPVDDAGRLDLRVLG